MRWSGLAIRDALTLERNDPTRRQEAPVSNRNGPPKTGTHVSVPIPSEVAKELLAATNSNDRYVLVREWRRGKRLRKIRAKYYIAPVSAGLVGGGHMMSHRLRDTFAVDLLEKGNPLEEVSKLLGHESIKTTERHYAKWVKGRQDRLDSLVVGTWEGPSMRSRSGKHSG